MGSTSSDDYLRQGEFRRWAGGVDEKLKSLDEKVTSHATLLAVDQDRKVRRTSTFHIVGGLIAAVVSALVSALTHSGGH